MEPSEEVSQSSLPANIQAHLAWLRTYMSLERTLDAWVRTAAALIGFGSSRSIARRGGCGATG